MAAHTLEGKRRRMLSHVELSIAMVRGELPDSGTPLERLEFARECLDEAIEIQKRIEKRDARKAKEVTA